jgi:hypothetical protein
MEAQKLSGGGGPVPRAASLVNPVAMDDGRETMDERERLRLPREGGSYGDGAILAAHFFCHISADNCPSSTPFT